MQLFATFYAVRCKKRLSQQNLPDSLVKLSINDITTPTSCESALEWRSCLP